MKPLPLVLLVASTLAAVAIFFFMRSEGQRKDRYSEAVDYGARLEQNLRFGEAAQTYTSALELELTDRERADLRYRLARAKIRGNNPAGALGVLQTLATEDVRRFNLEIGPLYLEAAEKAMAMEDLRLAKIILREGRGVSPHRTEDFQRRLDSMLEEPPEKPSPAK